MIYRIYGQKDTTIYEPSTRKQQNTGVDEILEVTKFYDEETEENFEGNSRVLIKFDISSISESVSSGEISASAKYYLNLTSTEQTEVQSEYELQVYQVSQSWSEGIGQFYDNPKTTNGSSWEYRTNDDKWTTGSFTSATTGSYISQAGGGTWFTASIDNTSYSQTFNKSTNDLSVEVTRYVADWLSGSRTNDGFIVKRADTQESGSVRYGSSKFFSSETHTIYVPTLEVRWIDSQFVTGSLQELTAENILIYPKTLYSEYKELSRARIRIVGREKYPTRTFSTSSAYTTVKYLPETTYYQVRDAETNLVIIPFDTTYTKVSCDSTGNYFDFRFNTLQPERFYQFEFRVDRSSRKEYFDGYIFKVVR
tara:strand:+ start:4264 stop:5361 length:1098 start_codon:yes stop_codon:yes gene_type:complete